MICNNVLEIEVFSEELCNKDSFILHDYSQFLTSFVEKERTESDCIDWEENGTYKWAKNELTLDNIGGFLAEKMSCLTALVMK